MTPIRESGWQVPPRWTLEVVTSPVLDDPVVVVAARDLPYVAHANRYQNLSVYLPHTADNAALVGTPVERLPWVDRDGDGLGAAVRCLVHIHGGAWRDPLLTSASIGPTVAHAFGDGGGPLEAIVSFNYTISQFPTHPTLPYDAIADNHTDIAREALHPQHVSDALRAFALLSSMGLEDGSSLLSGHSCGACLALQAVLESPAHHGVPHLSEAPRPAALLGMNGLYDLPELASADGLTPSHAHLRDDYEMFLSNAFGPAQERWPSFSPARLDLATIDARVREGRAPGLVVLGQSAEDQLVPVRQRELLTEHLGKVGSMTVTAGTRLSGPHASCWERGDMVWASVLEVLELLRRP